MALYRVRHTCGHAVDMQLYGPAAERERRLAWLRSRPCRDCERAEEASDARRQADALGLPPLEGTPKQAGWAERIRADFVRDVLSAMQNQDHVQFLDALRGIPDACQASWWIDNRYGLHKAFLAAYRAWEGEGGRKG